MQPPAPPLPSSSSSTPEFISPPLSERDITCDLSDPTSQQQLVQSITLSTLASTDHQPELTVNQITASTTTTTTTTTATTSTTIRSLTTTAPTPPPRPSNSIPPTLTQAKLSTAQISEALSKSSPAAVSVAVSVAAAAAVSTPVPIISIDTHSAHSPVINYQPRSVASTQQNR